MSHGRKRIRPLDPGEERGVHAADTLQLGSLDDDRSYCFSWPAAPLTAWVQSHSAYAERHVALSGSGAYKSDVGSSGSAHITTPAVFSVAALLPPSPSTARGPGSGLQLRVGHGSQPTEAGGQFPRPPAAGRNGAGKGGALLGWCGDMERLLAPIQAAAAGDGGGGIPLLKGTPRAAAHPLCPPRPLCTGEDSIFSLTATQLREAVAAGLLAADGAAGSLERRRRLEWEVVGLEWRAFRESRRTGAALQRLLSLAAAVPFDERGSTAGPAPVTGTGGRAAAFVPTTAWRRAVYDLWLRWRVGPGGGDGGGMAQQSALAAAATALPDLAAGHHPHPHHEGQQQQQQQQSWGAPLMPGAYLYDTQPDYFLNPARTAAAAAAPTSTGAGSGAAAESGVGGVGGTTALHRRRGLYGFLGWKIERYLPELQHLPPEALHDHHDDAEAAAGPPSRQQGGRHAASPAAVAPLERRGARRGRQKADASGDGAESDAPVPLSLDHAAFLPMPRRRQQRTEDIVAVEAGERGAGARLSSTSALLGANVVDVLAKRVLLAQPLVELALDAADGKDRLAALESTDLRRETEMWRVWLSRV